VLERMISNRFSKIPPPVDGKDGRDGKDGESVTVEQVAPLIERAVRVEVAKIPAAADGKDGKPGRDGRDGESVALSDVLPMVERSVGSEVSKMPIPKDGRDGRDGQDGEDGRDAAQIDPLDSIVEGRSYARGTWATRDGGLFRFNGSQWVCIMDGVTDVAEEMISPRKVRRTTRYASGKSTSIEVKLSAILYDEVWQEKAYEAGDCVTWDGSMWIAVKDTQPTDKPGESSAFRLSVKRGRNGKSPT